MIEEYRFGFIKINGKTYNHDVEIHWTGNVLQWQRARNHLIDLEDAQRAIKESPEIIIIGTGESGVAKVTERLKQELKLKKIELYIDLTDSAVKLFNILNKPSSENGKQIKVIGLFHLTC